MITQGRLKELVNYDLETGIFTWATTRKKCTIGHVAGSTRADGYTLIRLDYKRYYAHRLAWLYMTGEWARIVDHKDLNPLNNSWANLRKATPTESAQNRGAQSNNRLGLKGVSYNGYGFYAKIHVNGAHKHLGSFRTAEDAHNAYTAAAQAYHGEFARVS